MTSSVYYGQALRDCIKTTVQQIRDLQAEGATRADQALQELYHQDMVNAAARLVERIEEATAVLKSAVQCFAEEDEVTGDMLYSAKHSFEETTIDVADMYREMCLFDVRREVIKINNRSEAQP